MNKIKSWIDTVCINIKEYFFSLLKSSVQVSIYYFTIKIYESSVKIPEEDQLKTTAAFFLIIIFSEIRDLKKSNRSGLNQNIFNKNVPDTVPDKANKNTKIPNKRS